MKKHVYNTLRVLPSMSGIAIVPKQQAASTVPFPYLLHYAEDAPYRPDAITPDVLPSGQLITYVLRFVDQHEDDSRIRQVRRDAFEALVLTPVSTEVTTEDNETFQLTIEAQREWTIATDYYDEAGRPFTQRGFALTCEVYRA